MAIFHILTTERWAEAARAGEYRPPSLDAEGFIHFSEDHQLLRTANRFYSNATDLVVLSVRKDALTAELRYEEVDGDSFPHLYGPLPLAAVVEAVALRRGRDGAFTVPEEWAPWAPYFAPAP